MKYKLRVYTIWEVGQRKDAQGNPHQEDNIFPEYGKQSDDDRLFILCDGMGGHDAGEVASATVCEAMSQYILNDGHDKEGIFTPEDFSYALNQAFDALDKKDNGAEKKMGTTMTFLKLHEKGAFIAHMGDSRVYHIRPGKTGEETRFVSTTKDHSLVNDLIKIGELTEKEARYSKQKNVITRAMQPNMERRPKAEIHETSNIKPGDYFYMCSDGMLEQPEMEYGTDLLEIFSEMGGSDENKVANLKSKTEKNRDNHTAFIIHILEVEDPIDDNIEDNLVELDASEDTPIEVEATEYTSHEGSAPEATMDDGILSDENSIPAEDVKFIAIVEEDGNNNDSISELESSELSTDQKTPDTSSESIIPGESKVEFEKDTEPSSQIRSKNVSADSSKNSSKRSLTANAIRFLVTAIAVLAVIIGINIFRTCSKDKDDDWKENIITPDMQQSTLERVPNKPKKTSPTRSNAGSSNTSAPTAIEAANSTTANQLVSNEHLEATEQASQNSASGTPAIKIPPKKEDLEGVVESDQQKIQNLK